VYIWIDFQIIGFISCPTALKMGNSKEAIPGLSFWVIFDWPQYGVKAFENHLSSLCFLEKTDLISCKAVRGRGKDYKYYFILFYFIFLFIISSYCNFTMRNLKSMFLFFQFFLISQICRLYSYLLPLVACYPLLLQF